MQKEERKKSSSFIGLLFGPQWYDKGYALAGTGKVHGHLPSPREVVLRDGYWWALHRLRLSFRILVTTVDIFTSNGSSGIGNGNIHVRTVWFMWAQLQRARFAESVGSAPRIQVSSGVGVVRIVRLFIFNSLENLLYF